MRPRLFEIGVFAHAYVGVYLTRDEDNGVETEKAEHTED